MKFEYAGSLFDSAWEVRREAVHAFMTSSGMESVESGLEALEEDFEGVVSECHENWEIPHLDGTKQEYREVLLDWKSEHS